MLKWTRISLRQVGLGQYDVKSACVMCRCENFGRSTPVNRGACKVCLSFECETVWRFSEQHPLCRRLALHSLYLFKGPVTYCTALTFPFTTLGFELRMRDCVIGLGRELSTSLWVGIIMSLIPYMLITPETIVGMHNTWHILLFILTWSICRKRVACQL